MIPPIAEATGPQIKRELTDMLTAPSQSALGVGLVDLIERFVKRKLRFLAVSGKRLRDPCARPAESGAQVLTTGTKPTLQTRWLSHLTRRARSYLPPSLNIAKSFHGGLNVESRHGEYDQIEDADKNRCGEELWGKLEKTLTKADTSSDENGSAGDDKRRKKKYKVKR